MTLAGVFQRVSLAVLLFFAAGFVPSSRAEISTRPRADEVARAQAVKAAADRRVRAMVEELAEKPAAAGTPEQRVGDAYASFMNTARIDALGLKPLQADIERIRKVRSKREIAALYGQGNFIYNPFHLDVGADPNQPNRYALLLSQSGLDLHDSNPYLAMDAKAIEVREKFVVFLGKMLDLIDPKNSAQRARKILDFETAIARVSRPDEQENDAKKPLSPLTRAQLSKTAPGFDWSAYLESHGVDGQASVLVSQPDVIRGVAQVIDKTALQTLKDHLVFSIICTWGWVGALPQDIFDLQFDFYGRTRRGATQQPERWTRAYRFLNRTVGEDLGRLYAARYVPVAAQTPPQEGPQIRRDDVYGNAKRAHFWNWRRELSRLGHPVAKQGWPVDPVALQVELERRARAIHSRILPVDTHVDVLLPGTDERYYLPGHGDRASLEKLEQGGMGAVAFAVAVGYGPRTRAGVKEARAEADGKLKTIQSFIAAHADRVELALSTADIERIHAQGKIAIVESFLNARSIGKNLDGIDAFHKAGVRLFGLVHDGNNDFADSSRYDDARGPEHHGLSALGRQAIVRLNRLGMIVDVSQMSTEALLQTTRLSTAPVIASHSSARTLADNVRNLSDAELDAIKANGGTVHVTAFNGYLLQPPPDFAEKIRALRVEFGMKPDYDAVLGFTDGLEELPEPKQSKFFDRLAQLRAPATVKDFVDHIDYIVRRIGIGHAGIGSDFNHGSGIEGFNDEADAPNITCELLRRGYTEPQIAKIWGGNFLRVFREVEAVAKAQPQSTAAASHTETGQTFAGPGSKLYYEVIGTAAGTPLVLINGGPGFSHDHLHASPAWEILAKSRPIVFYDQRGTGLSTNPVSQTLEDQIADLEALRVELGAQRIDLLGHSWGGFLGMAYVARYPRRVAHLILADSAASRYGDTIYLFSKTFPDIEDPDSLGSYIKMIFYSPEKRDRYIEQLKTLPGGQARGVGEAIERDLNAKKYDLTPRIAQLKMPVLVMTGRYDMNVAPLVAWRIHKAIEGSRFVVFERSSHLPFYEEPDAFTRAVENFLKADIK